jgi:hypothetical protein
MMDGLMSLYVMFGLFQDGLVPSYAIIVRERLRAREAGARVGVVLMKSILGRHCGAGCPARFFDATRSYRAAFANGIAWNGLNFRNGVFLLFRIPIITPRSATARPTWSAAE